MLNSRIFLRASVVAVAAAGLTLASCSTSEEDSTAAPSSAAASAEKDKEAATSDSASSSAESGVTFEDAVVRAMEKDSDMTAIFGTLHNHTDKDINVVGFTSSVKAEHYEIHEVVDGVMQEKEGGFDLPAGESVELAPGSFHFMLMGVTEPVMAGETATLTLELSDGSTVDLGDIPVRSIGAGDENYGDMGGMDHGDDMDHGDMKHGDHMDHSESADMSGMKTEEHAH
ncbi:copper chaperone PCu(A)C [Corynebacterium guaraldiae]|uniref:copper chaperone PCu(A)C n=1 Tax=Corynebacterium guaraldiae TaxID=3051103 RepID=UPI0012B708AF|nr:copper chaperone PCu(A)C [Corynebacterium guaraldiae]MTD97762.1 copper chaperone PCu(A)C [Corynebacterium guaraldiae]